MDTPSGSNPHLLFKIKRKPCSVQIAHLLISHLVFHLTRCRDILIFKRDKGIFLYRPFLKLRSISALAFLLPLSSH